MYIMLIMVDQPEYKFNVDKANGVRRRHRRERHARKSHHTLG